MEAKAPPSMAGKVLCFKLANAVHIKARESYGFSRVARSPGNRVGMRIGYGCAVLNRTNSIAVSADGAKGPPFSTVLDTIKGRSGTNAKLLQGLAGSFTRRSIELVGEIYQQNLESFRSGQPCHHPFLKLREQIVNEAVQVVGIVTVGVNGGFGQLEEWRVPAGDQNG